MSPRLKGFAPAALMMFLALVLYSCSSDCPPIPPPPPNILQPLYVADIPSTISFRRVLDSLGDSIRVYAETVYFDTATKKYTEAARVGRFKGFAAESIKVERIAGLTYTYADPTVTLPKMISGPATGTVYNNSNIGITVGAGGGSWHAFWYLGIR